MRVYVIEYDNCEVYEDHQSWLGEVFVTRKLAEDYLDLKGFVKDVEDPEEKYIKETYIDKVPISAIAANIIEKDVRMTLT